ncbi:hypothetical protein [Leptospira kmetyi]|uniref:hypothetical protein n=1 Tax=Leptospira kmetyi TaxID=408139 RepID=UPI00028929A5|nr:hypothetical protein [Leptospira kmetyi]
MELSSKEESFALNGSLNFIENNRDESMYDSLSPAQLVVTLIRDLSYSVTQGLIYDYINNLDEVQIQQTYFSLMQLRVYELAGDYKGVMFLLPEMLSGSGIKEDDELVDLTIELIQRIGILEKKLEESESFLEFMIFEFINRNQLSI